jgi:putative flippase GtrA
MIERLYSLLRDFIFPKLRFAFASAFVTLLDYFFYLFLFYFFFSPVISNIISYSLLMILNFFLQKKFVFTLKGRSRIIFIQSMIFSVIGLLLSTLLIGGLNKFNFFYEYQFATKMLVTGIIFFYNYYTKRFAFEGK